ncbi:arsenite-resistant protein asr2 [Phaffia rhodozyma]|uniref:Arsenite-resistant protein asr2 n=1 Tax=Phaffia rhodozyma TaxID=264483 RepID=A0A0F7SU18_PHARH|nr:arsenite-resistant protein asr2 [Phaffia rhodozyma]
MSGLPPASNLPPRPAHLPAPPSFLPAPPISSISNTSSSGSRGDFYIPSYGRGDRDEWAVSSRDEDDRDRRDSLGRDYDDRKRRRSSSSSESPRKEARREPLSQNSAYPLASRMSSRQYYNPSSRSSGPSSGFSNSSTVIATDPDLSEHLMHFSDWAAAFRYQNPEVVATDDPMEQPKKMQERYETYRKKFLSRQLYGLFLLKKSECWFVEKYSLEPEMVAMRERVSQEGRIGLVDAFVTELKDGKFDQVSFDQVDGKDEKSELKPSEEEEDLRGDAQKQLVSVQPIPNQIFIKSLSPNVSRESVEKICKEISGFKRLSLGPPSEKRNFHRSAWVTFEEGTDLDATCAKLEGAQVGENGFTLHVAINSEPYVSRARLAPEGTNNLNRLNKDLTQAKAIAILFESQSLKKAGGEEVVGSEAIDQKVEELHGTTDLDGDAAVAKVKFHLDLYITYLRRAFHTCYYSASVADSAEELQRLSVRYLRKQKRASLSPAKEITALSPSVTERLEKDQNGDEEKVAEGEEKKKEATDVEEDQSEQAKASATGIGGESVASAKLSDLNMMIWSQDLDPKINIILNRTTIDPTEAGGKNVSEEIARIIGPFIKQEDEGKFRCKVCSKLFKAVDFVRKHIPLKHPEIMKPMDDVHFFNSFVLDPLHITPSPGAPAAVNDEIVPPRSRLPGGLMSIGSSTTASGFPMTGMPFYGATPMWMNPMGGSYNPGFVGLGGNNPYVPQPMFHPGVGFGMLGSRGGAAGGGMAGGRGAGRRGDEPVQVDTTLGRPEGVSEDPRAKKGRVSYNDLDASLPQGDLQLDY